MTLNKFPAIALAVVSSLVQLGGVAFYGWPVGNIFVLLWAENVIITLIATVRMATVTRQADPTATPWTKIGNSFRLLFFCLVHGIFTMVLAFITGFELTFAMFVVPLILIVVRYMAETIGWFASGERPATLSHAYGFAMRRVVMLHVAILACWGLMFYSMRGGGSLFGMVGDLGTTALLILALLLTIKTIAEIQSILVGPNAPTSWKFTR